MKIFYPFLFLSLFVFTGNSQTPLYNFDFKGGFQGWISNSIECGGSASDNAEWIWVDNGRIEGTLSNFGLMDSRTPENGIVILNSDLLDNNGDVNNIGNGDCPAPQVSELISPPLDFSDHDSVILSFNQLYFRFLGYYNEGKNIDYSDSTATFVGVSVDGQETWEEIPINTDLNIFRATQNYESELTLDISEYAAGESEVHVRFLWQGDYYVWALDDIRFYGSRLYDLDISEFKYPVSNFETPQVQFVNDTMRFEANVVNLSPKPVDSAYLYVTVRANEGEDRTVYFEDSTLIQNLTFNDTVEVQLPNYFVPENFEPGSYAFIYRLVNVKRPEEVNMANNVRADVMIVSENRFRKTDRGDSFGMPMEADYMVGNYFKISPNVQERLLLDNINFSAFGRDGRPLAGKEVAVYLLKIDDDVDENLENWNFTAALENKKSIAGIGSYIFTSQDDESQDLEERIVVKDLVDLDSYSDEIVLEPGGRYIALIEYTENAAKEIIHELGQRVVYYPISYPEQWNTMVYSGGQWYVNGFGAQYVAIIDIDVRMELTSTKEELTEQEVRIFPNPATDYVQIQLDLDRAQNVDVFLTDVSGKILKMNHHSKLYSDLLKVDVTSVPAGTYFLNVTTEEGRLTKKISVVR